MPGVQLDCLQYQRYVPRMPYAHPVDVRRRVRDEVDFAAAAGDAVYRLRGDRGGAAGGRR